VSVTVLVPIGRADIWSIIEGFFGSIWNGIVAFFGTIFGAIANALVQVIEIPFSGLQSSWNAFQVWANSYGPIAPLLTIGMIGLFLAVAAFFIWLLVKYSTSETEQTAEEVEEGV
jgi:hypothetical protein